MARVLLVEDEPNLRLTLEDNLQAEGHQVATAATAAQATAALSADAALEVVVLDVMLPDGDGYSVCRALRASGHGARVLMLTSRALEDDVVHGLSAGADDYLVKPYRLRELLARIAALARRGPGADPTLRVGPYTVEPQARAVREGEAPIALTRTEFDVLLCLAQARGAVRSRDAIIDAVWGEGVLVDVHTVDNFVSSLKRKLPKLALVTVRGVGFRLDVR
jgi:DNA-binding response OmpR family regulator